MKKFTKLQRKKIAKTKGINLDSTLVTPIIVKIIEEGVAANYVNDLTVVVAITDCRYITLITRDLKRHYKYQLSISDLRYSLRYEAINKCRNATAGERRRYMSGMITGDLKRTFRVGDVYKAIDLIKL